MIMWYNSNVCFHCHLLDNIGSERCCEALKKLEKHYDIVVNIQGDEPLIEPEIIDGVVMTLQVVTYKTLS